MKKVSQFLHNPDYCDNVITLITNSRKIMKNIHVFVGVRKEFDYFIKRWEFNIEDWVNVDNYDKARGRTYKKGHVHIGDSAFKLFRSNEILNYIEMKKS